jgi:hypothetical protein
MKAPEPLQRYFLYMLLKETADPIAYLTLPTRIEDRQWMMAGERNLWAAAWLGLCAGQEVQYAGARVASFSPVNVLVNETGSVSYGEGPGSHRVMRFEIRDKTNFAMAATSRTAALLADFPIVRR